MFKKIKIAKLKVGYDTRFTEGVFELSLALTR